MAIPFPKKRNNFKNLLENEQEGFWWNKAWRQGKKALARTPKPPQSRGLLFEALEPRVLMSADISYGSQILQTDQQANPSQFQLVDTNDTNQIVSSVDFSAASVDNQVLPYLGHDARISAANELTVFATGTIDLNSLRPDFLRDEGFNSLVIQGGDLTDDTLVVDLGQGDIPLMSP